MKLWIKFALAISTIIILLFGIGGHLMIQKSLDFSIVQIIRQYQYQHMHYRIFFENMIFADVGLPEEVNQTKIIETAEFIGGLSSFGIYHENSEPLYSSSTMPTDKTFIHELMSEQDGYVIQNYTDRTIIGVVSIENINGENLYLITVNDISEVFTQRDEQYQQMVLLYTVLLLITIGLVFILSMTITRPLKRLTIISKKIADGAFEQRTSITSKDEIGLLSDSFDKMAQSVEEKIGSLEQAVLAREDFISNFSHELKTPMTAIMGYADMLRSYESPPDVQIKAATHIYHESKRLTELSLRLLDFFALTDTPIHPIPTPTQKLRMDALQDIQWNLQPAIVLADLLLIQCVLRNLCDNAQKAGATDIRVDGYLGKAGYHVTVVDNGCGVPPEMFSRIGEPFFMVNKARSRENGGFGLGLALCNKILAQHGSALQIENTPAKGASIGFILTISTQH